MERKFYHENFEGSLKHDADQFKMYPSKKVWHGIYNDVHPGRRWPSVAISILFIFTLVIVGHLNTANPPGSISRIKPIQKTLAANKQDINRAAAKTINQGAQLNRRRSFPSNNPLGTIEIQDPLVGEATAEIASQNNLPGSSTGTIIQAPFNADKEKYNQPVPQLINSTEPQKQGIADNTGANKQVISDLPSMKIVNQPKDGMVSDLILPAIKTAVKTSTPETNTAKKITEESPQQLVNRQNKARKNKISLTLFMGPSLSYRTYSKADNPASITTSSIDPLATNNSNENAIERPSMGFKGGVSLNYNLTKKLKFIGGLQLGYSEFNKKASNIHPTIASLVLINSATGMPYTLTSFSHYGSRTGGPAELNLHNYSFAASTPVGFQYTVGGTDDLKLDVVTTFQPTYVITSQAYLLSSNNKYFISEPSLSRKWNMGISIGSLLSFGSGSYKWQVGPSIDYQLLSTYDSRYPVKEHLINYGVRMGLTKIKK